jgi:hypothetical protein
MPNRRKDLSHALSRILIASLLLFVLLPAAAFGWGDDSHRAAVRGALAVLPAEMGQFFQVNSRFIVEHSTDPDYIPDRTVEQKAEHFFDLDLYDVPPSEIPRDRSADEKRFGRDVVIERGLLPWAVEREYQRLVAALTSKDWQEARLAAAHLSHFTADATMPLHATSNYDGQRTGNLGIHGRIEWELVPRYLGGKIIPADGPAIIHDHVEWEELIYDRIAWAFEEIESGLALVDDINQADLACRKETVLDSEEYYAALNRRIGPMLERRLRAAATAIAKLYHTAWVEAGRPAMPPARAVMVLLDVPAEDFRSLQDAAVSEAARRSTSLGPQDVLAVIVANAPKRLWEFTVNWGPVCDVARDPAISYTGAESYALESALLALRRLPDSKRTLFILTDGLGADKRGLETLTLLEEMKVDVEIVSALKN